MKIKSVSTVGYESNCWLITDEKSGEFAIVDPSASIANIKEAIDLYGLDREKFKFALLTHGHFDHIYSVDAVRDEFSCDLCIHRDDADFLVDSLKNANKLFFGEDITYRPADKLLSDGDELYLGDTVIKVIHTPGHTPGCVCYLADNKLITGDTLFDMSIGRTDLFGGDTKTIYKSLKKIMSMDGSLRIYPGHGETSDINKQLKFNPYLKGILDNEY